MSVIDLPLHCLLVALVPFSLLVCCSPVERKGQEHAFLRSAPHPVEIFDNRRWEVPYLGGLAASLHGLGNLVSPLQVAFASL